MPNITKAPFITLSSAIFFISFITINPVSSSQIEDTKNVQFTKLEPGEQFPGGKTTHNKNLDVNSFSHGSANMSFEKQLDFKIGNAVFRRLWVSAPTVTQAADGLGPLFNARSCERCHLNDGRGHPPTDIIEGKKDNAVSMFLRLSIKPQNTAQQEALKSAKLTTINEPTYGSQLQDLSIRGIKAEGNIAIRYTEQTLSFSDGYQVSLRKPSYQVENLAYGPLHPDTLISPRIAPQMIGLGLLEAIKEEDILALSDPKDKNQDGISGKPNQVWSLEHNKLMLGRFGWKAGIATVNEQSQAAFFHDIGISVPLFKGGAGECTSKQTDCLKAPTGDSPQYENLESGKTMTDLAVFYSRNLAVPPRRSPLNPSVLRGKSLFYQIGCQGCHHPNYQTRSDSIGKEQSNQKIWPYTDLLLHDMGAGLADNRPEGKANGQEWRTAPLWGIGLTPKVNKHSFYLHDGRARNILEAILWHGGEAKAQQQAVLKLNSQQREDLIKFINSL